jgi:hypothetical protein
LAAHPLITEDTGTQGEGRFQLELTGERGYDQDDGGRTNTTMTTSVLSYGVRENLDTIFTFPVIREATFTEEETTTYRGVGDYGFDLKWRFFEEGDLSIALKPGMTYPSGDDTKGLGTGKLSYSLYWVTTWEPRPWAVHLHLGYVRNRNALDEREGLWHASVGGWYTFFGKLKLAADAGMDATPTRAFNTHPAFGIVGLIYSVTPQFDFDLGVKRALSDTETDRTLLLGVTLRF